MLQYLKTYLLFGNRFCGVENSLKNGTEILYTTILKKTKKEVTIDRTYSSESIREVFEKLSKNQHIFLIINNDQVLTKSIESNQMDDLKLVNQAFPNINISEFYFEIIKQNNTGFVSICRKKYVDNLIDEYAKNKIYVVSFTLGNSIISNTIGYVGSRSVFTSNAHVYKNDNVIYKIDFTEETKKLDYEVNGLHVFSSYMLSFSGALSNILNNYFPIVSYQEKKNSLLNTFKQIRFFSQFLKIGLIFILGLLLVNFLFFNFYFEKTKVLNETSQINQAAKETVIKLNETVSKLQKMTDDMLKSSASKSSFYIHTIVNRLPESILLSEINYQPLEKKIKKDKTIILQKNTIIVSGNSNDSQRYSEWISVLENVDWVTHIDVIDYSDLKRITSHFSIKINMTDDL